MSASANRYASLAPSDLTTPKKRKGKKTSPGASPPPGSVESLKSNGNCQENGNENGNGMLHRGGKVSEKAVDEDDALEMGGDGEARKSRRALTGGKNGSGNFPELAGDEAKQRIGGLTPKDQKAMVLLVSLCKPCSWV